MSGSEPGPLSSCPSIQFVVSAPHNAASSLHLSAPNKLTLLGDHVGSTSQMGMEEG